jgi:DNA-binding XRE family transcriptional regulator
LAAVRRDAGYSQAKLAQLIDVSYVTIWRAETGRTVPGANTVAAWAQACGVPVESLYSEEAA